MISNKLYVVFLDLLGFSWILENNEETALHCLDSIQLILKTKYQDSITHPYDSYSDKNVSDFALKSEISSFSHMINISDSLIIASSDHQNFIPQLCNFLSTTYFEYVTKSFRQPFSDINTVENLKIYKSYPKSDKHYHPKAFPILFKGGLSFGEEINFFERLGFNEHNQCSTLSVSGRTYLKAVKLEKAGKGPRIFCSKESIESLKGDCLNSVRKIDEQTYEIIWTYYAFETGSRSSDKNTNIEEGLGKLLPPAINLYNYYASLYDASKADNEQELCHYRELIKLICRGACQYARTNEIDITSIINYLNNQIKNLKFFKWEMKEEELNSFIQ